MRVFSWKRLGVPLVRYYTSSQPTPKELSFYDSFVETEIDYNDVILRESQQKHGVPLNLPPQLPPPNEPEPVWCASLQEKLKRAPPPYQPTHDPPPIETTGVDKPLPPTKSRLQKITASTKAADPPELRFPKLEEAVQLLTKIWDKHATSQKIPKYVETTKFDWRATDKKASVSIATEAKSTLQSAFKNPLGESEVDLSDIAASSGSPFVQPGKEMPQVGKTDRKFHCLECTKTFRMLDALVNHYQTKHGKRIPEEQYEKYKAMDMGKAPPKVQEYGPDSKAAEQQLLPEKEISAHINAGFNVKLIGEVKELHHGFIKSTVVTQILLQTGETDEDAELHTVRCFGEQFGEAVRQKVKEGTLLLIQGLYKSNYLIDEVSRKRHAYPFVQVASPYGDVHILQ